MRNFQVRLNDELYSAIEGLAAEREATNVSVIRNALDLRIQSEPHANAGRRLIAEDSDTHEKTELIILRLTKKTK